MYCIFWVIYSESSNKCLFIDHFKSSLFVMWFCRVRPVGSTSEGDLDFDRMKQV